MTGASFIALVGTLSVVPTIPVAGMALILGIDRFMSEHVSGRHDEADHRFRTTETLELLRGQPEYRVPGRETFEPTESFNPARPYKTRLKWRDLTGGEQ